MSLFWKIMIGAAVLVVLGWIGYGIWDWRERKLEKQRPRERSERYKQATSSVVDWAKKMAEYQPPKQPKKPEPPASPDSRPASQGGPGQGPAET